MKLRPVLRTDAPPAPDDTTLTALEELAAGIGDPGWEAELVFVDDAEMARLNAAWRGKEGPTDVLSFTNLLDTGSGEPAIRAERGHAAADLWWEADAAESGEAGSIVVAPRFVAERCAANGWDPEDELALLVVHGALHLLGWDHETVDEAVAMRECERGILAACGRRHPLIQDGT